MTGTWHGNGKRENSKNQILLVGTQIHETLDRETLVFKKSYQNQKNRTEICAIFKTKQKDKGMFQSNDYTFIYRYIEKEN